MICLDSTLQPLMPQPATVEACSYVIFSGAEAIQLQASPLNLSIADASAIGSAILAVWGVAYGFRMVREFFNGWDVSRPNSEE